MRRCAIAVLALVACGGERPLPMKAALSALDRLDVAEADPLLAAARTALAGGTLDPEVRAELLASTDPAHARAQRILLAMDRKPVVEASPPPKHGAKTPPPLRVATAPPQPMVRKRAPVGPIPASTAPSTAAPSKPPPRPRATLRSLALSSTKSGAALTLSGSGGLVVGVANQPSSGIVRFVMEGTADPNALRARPRVTGARVTGVRRVGRSVFVTMRLDPGWHLGRIKKTGGGAKVQLRRST